MKILNQVNLIGKNQTRSNSVKSKTDGLLVKEGKNT